MQPENIRIQKTIYRSLLTIRREFADPDGVQIITNA